MKLVLAVCDLVRDASSIMMSRPEHIRQKSTRSDFVTEADVHVQEVLSEGLLKLLPGSEVCGEESIDHSTHGGDVWIVDPIDGTSNFIRDLGASVVSVGLKRGGALYLGVIYNPYRDEMFYAGKGCGTWLNGKRVTVSDNDFAHSHFCTAMSVYDKSYAPQCFRILEEVYPACDDLRRFGAAAFELAQLAAGRVEMFFEMRLCPWDCAAAAILIEEAGGYWECLYQDGLPTDRMFAFLAANTKENFDRLRKIVAREIPEIPYDPSI